MHDLEEENRQLKRMFADFFLEKCALKNVIGKKQAVLNMYVFESLEDVKTETESWLNVYKRYRPYESTNNLSPREYLQKFNPETVI